MEQLIIGGAKKIIAAGCCGSLVEAIERVNRPYRKCKTWTTEWKR